MTAFPFTRLSTRVLLISTLLASLAACATVTVPTQTAPAGLPAAPARASAGPSVETLVFIRHGEKPSGGLGQLDCQGLNRALALPSVLVGKYGRPGYLFAPNPSDRKPDGGVPYDYIRPLATIEPTAIALGLPVNVQYSSLDTADLRRTLLSFPYQNAVSFIAWEHVQLVEVVRSLLAANGGDPAQAPEWNHNDFDSIYVVRITRAHGQVSATFHKDAEGLAHLSTQCPAPRLENP